MSRSQRKFAFRRVHYGFAQYSWTGDTCIVYQLPVFKGTSEWFRVSRETLCCRFSFLLIYATYMGISVEHNCEGKWWVVFFQSFSSVHHYVHLFHWKDMVMIQRPVWSHLISVFPSISIIDLPVRCDNKSISRSIGHSVDRAVSHSQATSLLFPLGKIVQSTSDAVRVVPSVCRFIGKLISDRQRRITNHGYSWIRI